MRVVSQAVKLHPIMTEQSAEKSQTGQKRSGERPVELLTGFEPLIVNECLIRIKSQFKS